MDKIKFNNSEYPKFQSEWFAAKYSFPFAKEFCDGRGVDVGCHKVEWAYPGSYPVDIIFEDGKYHAMNLPILSICGLDYIFSSHCLEHLDDWVGVLEYWNSQLRKGGILFLYLPDYSQEYWRPWNNRKHKHIFTPEIIQDYIKDKHYLWKDSYVSNVDLNNSFIVVLEKYND